MRLALALTLGLRGLYLARFGWDPMWMNAVYLAQARSLLIPPSRIWGPPAPLLCIVALRAAGLSAIGALEVMYLAAHLLFAAGVIGIARWIWPTIPRLREASLAVAVAALPMIAAIPGTRTSAPCWAQACSQRFLRWRSDVCRRGGGADGCGCRSAPCLRARRGSKRWRASWASPR